MKCLLQRVRQAAVSIDGVTVSSIGPGLLVFLGIEQHDDAAAVARMSQRLLGYRVFSDAEGRMNLSVRDVAGEVLMVSQFTLAADTQKGARPSFSSAAPPAVARTLYDDFVDAVRADLGRVATGQFAADMQVSLVNDGPVTFLLES
jgi:D-tyrosyl-tRNA(Tyr) deacylase